jgi:hypothetical protein
MHDAGGTLVHTCMDIYMAFDLVSLINLGRYLITEGKKQFPSTSFGYLDRYQNSIYILFIEKKKNSIYIMKREAEDKKK